MIFSAMTKNRLTVNRIKSYMAMEGMKEFYTIIPIEYMRIKKYTNISEGV